MPPHGTGNAWPGQVRHPAPATCAALAIHPPGQGKILPERPEYSGKKKGPD
jgi:hypothetical protein